MALFSSFAQTLSAAKSLFFETKSQASSIGAAVFGNRSTGGGGGTLSFREAVDKGYKNLIWVHRCISATGAAVGSVPWKAYKKQTSDSRYIHLPGHPFETLVESPNPYYTRKELMEAWTIYLQLAGESYFEVVFVQGKPYQLMCLRPDWMTPTPDPVNYIKDYKLDAGGARKATFKPEEILRFKYLDPMNEYKGLSPLAAAARTISTEDSAVKWNKSIFDNSAVPNGILKIPATTVSKKERDALKGELEAEFTTENMHRPMVLWGGMEWQKMSMDAKDLDWINQRQLSKYEICAVLDTPPQVVGATADPTYANYDVARTAWWEDSIISKLEWYQAKINQQLGPYFGGDVVVRYDISDVPAMRASFSAKVDTSHKLWSMGYPINAINKRVGLGFDNIPWGDAWWAQMNMMPVTSLDSNPAIEAPHPPDQLTAPDVEGDGPNPF